MPNRWIAVYECYEKNDKLLIKGTSEEVAELIGCNRSTVNAYAFTDKPVFEKYFIKKVDTVLVNVEYKQRRKVEKKAETFNDNTLDYLVRHLKRYGNTVLPTRTNPNKYLEALRSMGLDCFVRKVNDVLDNKKIGWYYIIEVK